MAKLIGPDFIALQVRDLEVSKRFYTERVGLELADRSPPDAVVFDTKPIPFAIRKPLVDLDAPAAWAGASRSGLHATMPRICTHR